MNLRITQVQDLIGKRHVIGARGPDAYDCWGLCIEVYRRGGIELPDFAAPTRALVRELVDNVAQNLVDWLDRPTQWGFVYCQRHGHIGMYYQDRVLHCAINVGVVFQRIDQFMMIYPGLTFARWRL